MLVEGGPAVKHSQIDLKMHRPAGMVSFVFDPCSSILVQIASLPT